MSLKEVPSMISIGFQVRLIHSENGIKMSSVHYYMCELDNAIVCSISILHWWGGG
jgi:hypothetical protein